MIHVCDGSTGMKLVSLGQWLFHAIAPAVPRQAVPPIMGKCMNLDLQRIGSKGITVRFMGDPA